MSDNLNHTTGNSEQDASKLNAEYAMIFDVISKFPEILTEQELIKKLLDTFMMLFMPRRIGYYCMGRTIDAPSISDENMALLQSCIDNPNHRYVYSTAGNGFLLRLDFKDEVYGVMEIDELAFPEYRDRYLSLMLNVSKICGLAISNARRYEAINESRDKLAAINTKLQAEIMQRQMAQNALSRLNSELEDEVRKRTIQLQDLNTSLEEEIAERQIAQESLSKLNAELEDQVIQRTSQLQAINAALEEEIAERQGAQDELQMSRDRLMASKAMLKQYSAKLEESNHEIKSFANIVAHDFRSPIINIKGFSQELGFSVRELKEILRDVTTEMPDKVHSRVDELLEEDIPDAQKFIDSSVDRLDKMVDALLRLARLGRRETENVSVAMSELVAATVQLHRHEIEKRDIAVNVGALPVIITDRLAMEQIIGNLLDNAVKYLEDGRPGEIKVYFTETNGEYVFTVEDNGRGIADNDYEKIFEIFRRSGKQDRAGEGMGLAYVKTLVRQLGGKIWCESTLGVGTKMHFTVPKTL